MLPKLSKAPLYALLINYYYFVGATHPDQKGVSQRCEVFKALLLFKNADFQQTWNYVRQTRCLDLNIE